MTTFATILDQLWALPVSNLQKIKVSIDDIIESKVRSSLYVDQEVYVIQRSKKESGVIKKINKTRAIVIMDNRDWNVPFSMIEVKN